MNRLFTTALIVFIAFNSTAQIINVHTSNELQSALNNAQPGHIITLDANTTYSIANCSNCITNNGSGFKVPAGIHGTPTNPIKLKGVRSSIIASGDINSKYGLHLQGNNYWVIEGFTVTTSSKCVMLDSSSHNVINDLKIIRSGYEALHLRKFSCYNTVSNCYFDSTGLNASAASSGYAEAVYIGSAKSNWLTYSNAKVDTCDYNTITANVFGGNIKSENIDVKEGTKWGVISKNTFNGLGCNGANSADSYLDLKGDYYIVECNTGGNNGPQILDGFQTHINKVTTQDGTVYNRNFGDYNTFRGNTLDMTGTAGYAINVASYSGLVHNSVCTNNVAINAALGLTNITTTTCATIVCNVTTGTTKPNAVVASSIAPNPFSEQLAIVSTSLASIDKIELIDLNGNTVLNQEVYSNDFLLQTTGVSAGIYVLKISYNNNTYDVRRVVKM
jgi:transcription elongation factor Elf1